MSTIYKIPIIRTLYREYTKIHFQKKWRQQNRHNHTAAGNIFPIELVKVGIQSYGELNIRSFSSTSGEFLSIGNYVSIASGVLFILGGNHRMQTITTYPILSEQPEPHHSEIRSNGAIIIEDEVWIGTNAMILSGITVGKGAVIGAGAVVTRNVPPFAIVGGNPAQIIKYRFSNEIIDVISSFSIKEISLSILKDNHEYITKDINSIDDAQYIINKLLEKENIKK